VQVLGWVIVLVAALASAVGVFSAGGPGRHEVVGLHGATVTLSGQGLFGHDTLLIGAGNRGQDAVVLFLEVPLLAGVLLLSRRGGLRSRLTLAGTLGFFAYYYTSMCFATAYNRLFAAYVVLFGASVFAFVLAVAGLDAQDVADAFPPRPSRRVIAGYLLTVAALLTAVWLPAMLGALISGDTPALVNTYTAETTWALDLGLIVPVVVCAAVLLLRGRPMGYLMAVLVIVLNLTIGLVLISQGVAQIVVHVLSAGEVAGMVVTFAVLTVVAGGLLAALLRGWLPEREAGAGPARAPHPPAT
jgi:hypothetical protein